MKQLKVNSVSVVKHGRKLLDDVTLEIEAGELVAIVGPNGAGKTTLLRAIAHLEPPTSGKVSLDGLAVAHMSPSERARHIGYHPQNPQVHWPLPVADIVALGRVPHGYGPGRLTPQDRTVVQRTIAHTRLNALLDRRADTLSGGELGRVHIARLLAGEHALLLTDEPIANLDPRFQVDILNLLRDHTNDHSAGVVVLHDLAIAARYCDRLILLHRGRIDRQGSPSQVLTAETISAVFGVAPAYYVDAGIEHALSIREARGASATTSE